MTLILLAGENNENLDLFSEPQFPRLSPSRGGHGVEIRGGLSGVVPRDESEPSSGEGGDDRYYVDAHGRAICRICRKDYTVRGLPNHYRQAHPVENNARIDVERTKERWSEEEIRIMARKEALILIATPGVRNMNQLLLAQLPGRTLEAIKGKRRQLQYKAFVQEFLAGMDQDQPSEDPLDVDQSGLNQDVMEKLKLHLLSLKEKCMSMPMTAARVMCTLMNKVLQGDDIEDRQLLDWVKLATGATLEARLAVCRDRNQPPEPSNRRQRRRQEYTAIQRLYRSNQSRAAQIVLEPPVVGAPSANAEDMMQFWSDLLQAGSPSVSGSVRVMSNELENLWDPVTCEDIQGNELDMKTASGLDGVTMSMWKGVKPELRAAFFTLIMIRGAFPSLLSKGRTIFIPKNPEGSTDPKDYRPITVTSVIMRQLHKVLAGRLMRKHNWDERQRAFIGGVDGSAENLLSLQTIIHKARKEVKELHLASVDVAKAYDQVSHAAVMLALKRWGAPNMFIEYMSRSYGEMKTVLRYKDVERECTVRRGVRQGDPLSPPLFNLVLEEPLCSLSEDVGFRITPEKRVNALAFADDALLIASTANGLQMNLNTFGEELKAKGLSLNTDKCFVVSIKPSGRVKKTKILTEPQVQYQGNPIRQIDMVGLWKYLGVEFKGPKTVVAGDSMSKYLERVTKAPLKPQQRLQILRVYLIPKYLHAWTLGILRYRLLKRFDIDIRKAVRKWLRLPHDTPVGFFHAPLDEGGLGISELYTTVPALRLRRLKNLAESNSTIFQALYQLSIVTTQVDQLEKLLFRVAPGGDGRLLRKHWATKLHASVDGRHLKDTCKASASYHWVDKGAHVMSGADYVHMIHTKIGALPTRARCGRGRAVDVRCRACSYRSRPGLQVPIETLYHVVQECGRTHGGRILRHDKVCRMLGDCLEAKGWTVVREPLIQTREGNKKPDLVCTKEDQVVVVDANIVASSAIQSAFNLKQQKYGSSSMIDAVNQRFGGAGTQVAVLPVTISWRGVLNQASWKGLINMGVTRTVINTAVRYVVFGTYLSFRRFMETTR